MRNSSLKSIAISAAAVAASLAVACSSSSSLPAYDHTLTTAPSGELVLHVDSVADISARALRAALFTEAARETLNRGQIYLRVDEVSTGEGVDVSRQTHVDPIGSTPGGGGTPTVPSSSEVSFSRHRSGEIRFVPSKEAMTGERVFEAARLLDEISAGRIPPSP